MTKKNTQRTLKQLNVKREVSKISKTKTAIKIEGGKPATKADLFHVQQTLAVKIDAALMSAASTSNILVEKGVCTWDEIKVGEKNMMSILTFVRETMIEATNHLGKKIDKEDIGSFIYDKAVSSNINLDVLDGVFGIKKSESRIIKPSQVSVIHQDNR